MDENQNQVQPEAPKKKKFYKKWWFWAIVFVVLIAAFSGGSEAPENVQQTSGTSTTSTQPVTPTKTEPPKESAEEFKASCKKISFDDLARDTEKYKGERVTFTGEIIQILESGNSTVMRINVTKGEYEIWEDTILVNYTRSADESRFLEDDIIQFWGTIKGRRTYESVLGSEITLPEVDAKYTSLVQKKTSS